MPERGGEADQEEEEVVELGGAAAGFEQQQQQQPQSQGVEIGFMGREDGRRGICGRDIGRRYRGVGGAGRSMRMMPVRLVGWGCWILGRART